LINREEAKPLLFQGHRCWWSHPQKSSHNGGFRACCTDWTPTMLYFQVPWMLAALFCTSWEYSTWYLIADTWFLILVQLTPFSLLLDWRWINLILKNINK
jgi:hypothetical protein